MANHFNDLLLETLKDVRIRLERLEGRVDHIVNEKADKADIQDLKADGRDLKAELKAVTEKLDQKADKADIQDLKADGQNLKAELKADGQNLKADIQDLKADGQNLKAELKADFNTLNDKVQSHDRRLERIETGIKTLQWTMTAGLAILGIILAFVRSC